MYNNVVDNNMRGSLTKNWRDLSIPKNGAINSSLFPWDVVFIIVDLSVCSSSTCSAMHRCP